MNAVISLQRLPSCMLAHEQGTVHLSAMRCPFFRVLSFQPMLHAMALLAQRKWLHKFITSDHGTDPCAGRHTTDIPRIDVMGNSAQSACSPQKYIAVCGVLLVAFSMDKTFLMFESVTGCLQLVYGLEHLVEVTVAKKIPAAAAATTLIARLANNVVGGENFIDMARWTGIQ